jgi:hypothetical protein
VWRLRNETAGRDLLTNMTNQSGDESYFITEGFQAIVSDSLGVARWSVPQGVRWWSWENANGFHLEGFNGAIGWGGTYPYNRTTITSGALTDVIILLAETDANGAPRANDPNVSHAYRYVRNAHLPPARPEFAPHIVNTRADFVFQDFKASVPWAAYEYDRATQSMGRRLSLGFLENNVEAGLVDGKWWPPVFTTSNTQASGPQEWFFIFALDYSATPNPLLASAAATMFEGEAKPILFWGTVTRRSPNPIAGSNSLLIQAHRSNGTEDEFTFTTRAPVFDRTLAQAEALREINVFPNPYDEVTLTAVGSVATVEQRFVTFGHLPEKAVLRVFNLAGHLVKTIHKDDASAYARWDLLNEAGRPAASGMYLVHVELPELGVSKVLKLAIVQR